MVVVELSQIPTVHPSNGSRSLARHIVQGGLKDDLMITKSRGYDHMKPSATRRFVLGPKIGRVTGPDASASRRGLGRMIKLRLCLAWLSFKAAKLSWCLAESQRAPATNNHRHTRWSSPRELRGELQDLVSAHNVDVSCEAETCSSVRTKGPLLPNGAASHFLSAHLQYTLSHGTMLTSALILSCAGAALASQGFIQLDLEHEYGPRLTKRQTNQ